MPKAKPSCFGGYATLAALMRDCASCDFEYSCKESTQAQGRTFLPPKGEIKPLFPSPSGKEISAELASAHWAYIESVLKAHSIPQTQINLCGHHYLSAFEHGFKHGVEWKMEQKP